MTDNQDTYYFYIKEKNEVVECDKAKYMELIDQYGYPNCISLAKIPLNENNVDLRRLKDINLFLAELGFDMLRYERLFYIEIITINTRCDNNGYTVINRPPMFETMVFINEDYSFGQHQRFSDLEEAKKYHEDIVNKITAKLGDLINGWV
jgi:hypothetical protein